MTGLLENISRMQNAELIGLAKNRFLPENIQMAIAKHPYARAHWYLAENDGLQSSVRDYLWSDDCNRGYSLKTLLLANGRYNEDPEKFRELYRRYPSAWNRSTWKMSSAFFGNYWHRNIQIPGCPGDLLNTIYDEKYDPKTRSAKPQGWYSPKYELQRLAKHPNVDLGLAIKLSQCGIEDIQKIGFNKIVELSR